MASTDDILKKYGARRLIASRLDLAENDKLEKTNGKH